MTPAPAGRTRLLHSDELTRYDFGEDHPMAPGRVRHAVELARSLGVLDAMEVVEPPPADLELVRSVHTDDYIDAVRLAVSDPRHGLGTTDNPVRPGMHEVSARVLTATVAAARAVWTGEVDRAVNISGGLHHAMPDRASGFCIYNDGAAAIRWLLDQGCERVAYVDVDVHHGDGVQAIFYDDPRVLTVSLHETPQVLFPGTGFPTETGGPNAPGSAVNLALPPHTNDAGWLRAFEAVVPEALAAFAPQVLITQHGCDSHRHDPLADLELTVDGQRASYLRLSELADELCEGRWVATGGGGYAVVDVVPRAWAHLMAIAARQPVEVSTPIPQSWRDAVGERAPRAMGDGVDVGYTPITAGFDPASRLDQAILATRRAVFPELGLDPGL
ncbi:acetoin utilization protein AcuC [Friedmanniella endophytica]|uniref:Acetoin utilization protein AcuC n=1 Tax=Microlunatus kandeliicorticis TaxID=1759536 RepID=A0A7W3P4F5_9ACTN|nr:acetoin utilization protein AcuC [Microlunatus kandeliicorticis]MBA8792750.1 acetoin utilization protein AcuC [Microlunatus kandeliicorticis]